MITGIIIGLLIGSAILTILGFVGAGVFYLLKGLVLLFLKMIEPVFWGIFKVFGWIDDKVEALINKLKENIKHHFCIAV